ncbi:hypothetical protein SPBRAN_829 [uncultured Candidatus Thioglobus sp.]|nr:hypothetical protein SPBRAN_829 [uncultured Candidatus Thioglobus sp.]
MDESLNASDISDTTAIMLPPDVFTTIRGNDTSIVFSMFDSSLLYPLTNKTLEDFDVASTVVSATIIGSEDMISANITVVLRLNIEVIVCMPTLCCIYCTFIVQDSQLPVCVFWDKNAAGTYIRTYQPIIMLSVYLLQLCACYVGGGMGNWSSEGCEMVDRHINTVICRCNHLSSFGVLVVCIACMIVYCYNKSFCRIQIQLVVGLDPYPIQQ